MLHSDQLLAAPIILVSKKLFPNLNVRFATSAHAELKQNKSGHSSSALLPRVPSESLAFHAVRLTEPITEAKWFRGRAHDGGLGFCFISLSEV